MSWPFIVNLGLGEQEATRLTNTSPAPPPQRFLLLCLGMKYALARGFVMSPILLAKLETMVPYVSSFSGVQLPMINSNRLRLEYL